MINVHTKFKVSKLFQRYLTSSKLLLHLAFSDKITALSKAYYYHIRQLRCIRPYLDSSTACTIATFIVHPKLDYCNSLYYKLPKWRICANDECT